MKIALYTLILKNIIIHYPPLETSLLEKKGLFKILQKNTKTIERTIDRLIDFRIILRTILIIKRDE